MLSDKPNEWEKIEQKRRYLKVETTMPHITHTISLSERALVHNSS